MNTGFEWPQVRHLQQEGFEVLQVVLFDFFALNVKGGQKA
jgi:hypothetical protein